MFINITATERNIYVLLNNIWLIIISNLDLLIILATQLFLFLYIMLLLIFCVQFVLWVHSITTMVSTYCSCFDLPFILAKQRNDSVTVFIYVFSHLLYFTNSFFIYQNSTAVFICHYWDFVDRMKTLQTNFLSWWYLFVILIFQ